MSPFEIHAHRHRVVYELCAFHVHWRNALFHPVDQCLQHIVFRLKRYTSCCCVSTLAEDPRPGARAAMIHARYLEVAYPLIHVCVRSLTLKVFVEAIAVE